MNATAPCGHPGEYVIGTFIRCFTAGCDGKKRDAVPAHIDAEKTDKIRVCRKCGSTDVRFEFYNVYTGAPTYRCVACRKLST